MKTYIRVLIMTMIISLFSPLCTYAATASIDSVVFKTDVRTVIPGEVSEAITIQLQNSGGTEEKLDDTADVVFTSTGSGEFLGGTGKPITKSMSKGSANKTFYYKDSTAGTYTISVTVTPRSGGGTWEASQTIYVGEGGGTEEDKEDEENDDEDKDTVATSTTKKESSTTSSGSSGSGTHSRSVKLSNYSRKVSLQTGAGRERTVLVNSPVTFDAETNHDTSTVRPKMKFLWTFGDGASKLGRVVTHTYQFPGEYNVVLNTSNKKEYSVARTKVTVVPAEVEVGGFESGVTGYIELKNSSKGEINLDKWRLKVGDKDYLIPEDTIVSPGRSIKIPNNITRLLPTDSVELLFPSKQVALTYSPKSSVHVAVAQATTTSDVIVPTPVTVAAPILINEPIIFETEEPIPKEIIPAPSPIPATTTYIDNTAAVADSPAGERGVGKMVKFIQSLFTVHE